MAPKSWRISKCMTLNDLSRLMGGISVSYISVVENGKKPASGRIQRLYYKLSQGQVTPTDFFHGGES